MNLIAHFMLIGLAGIEGSLVKCEAHGVALVRPLDTAGQAFVLQVSGNRSPPAQPKVARRLNDEKAIQGTWRVVDGTRAGDGVQPDFKKITVEITKDRFLFKQATIRNFAYVLDPSRKPKHIDATLLDGPKKDFVFEGIYSLAGDELQISLGMIDSPARPQEFTDGRLQLILKRQNKELPPPQLDRKSSAYKKDPGKIVFDRFDGKDASDVFQTEPSEQFSPKALPKTLNLDMQSKPWKAVFEWLSEQTRLPVVAGQVPAGTLSVLSPRNKTYNLSEVIDVLNEALIDQKYLLIRGDQSIRLVPADAKIDPTLLPRVSLDELGNRGRTELVSVELPLRHVKAAELGSEVKKLVGPFGGVAVLDGRANRLVIHDAAGNLRRIVQTIREVEAKNKPNMP